MDPETPCKIDATFHDWRTVKGRKMLQLVFEIPIEKQGEVLTLLGHPEPSGSKWCMIALKAPEKPAQARGAEKSKRPFSELSLPAQCAIRCDDGRFQRFFTEVYDFPADPDLSDTELVTRAVRHHLGVNSRSDLSTNHDAANRWRKLESEFQQWLTDETYGDRAR